MRKRLVVESDGAVELSGLQLANGSRPRRLSCPYRSKRRVRVPPAQRDLEAGCPSSGQQIIRALTEVSPLRLTRTISRSARVDVAPRL